MKTAFLFTGQGAQVVGMGKDIADSIPAAAAVFKKANDIVGFDLSDVCFNGPAEKLNTTTMSQPAIFVTSAALLETLRTNPATSGIRPDVTAGLSLGEYTALYAAGAITFEDALKLVQKRGQAMQAAADTEHGGMVSIIGLDEEKVNQLCKEAGGGELLAPANFNCPGQVVISGTKAACTRAVELAEKYGAMKAIMLEVAGAFHSPMMSSAAEALQKALADCKVNGPAEIKTLANVNAEYYQSAEEIRAGLSKQLTCPVLWQRCMERMIADKVERFIEIGPGRVLAGLARRIERRLNIVSANNIQTINEIK